MERVKYRTICYGWYEVGTIIPNDPTSPHGKEDGKYEWDLISTEVIQGVQSSTAYPSSGSTTTDVFGGDGTKFLIMWTWKGTFRVSKIIDEAELKVM